MVPNIGCSKGASFRGAGAYHLHDKSAVTAERVGWTATRNLVNDDPAKAIDEMWRTAEAAAQLKRMSGRHAQGRKCDDPVKTVSLSWAPHQSPTRTEMEQAADSFLSAMGWQGHQALLICHTDTAHPHLHMILNRIHPDTGMVLNDWREQQRAQRWADRYEREQGQVLCHARAQKYENARWDLQADGRPYPYAKLAQEQERALDTAMALAAVQDMVEKDMLADRQRREREAFLASGRMQFRAARQEAYREVREEFKAHWREHFRHARDLHDRFEGRAERAHAEALSLARAGDHAAAAQVLANFHDERDTAFADLAAGRKELRDLQLETTRSRQDEACRSLIGLRGEAFEVIKERQKEERAEYREMIALRDAGASFGVDRYQQLLGLDAARIANDNGRAADIDRVEFGDMRRHAAEPAINPFTQRAQELFAEAGYRDPQAKSATRGHDRCRCRRHRRGH